MMFIIPNVYWNVFTLYMHTIDTDYNVPGIQRTNAYNVLRYLIVTNDTNDSDTNEIYII